MLSTDTAETNTKVTRRHGSKFYLLCCCHDSPPPEASMIIIIPSSSGFKVYRNRTRTRGGREEGRNKLLSPTLRLKPYSSFEEKQLANVPPTCHGQSSLYFHVCHPPLLFSTSRYSTVLQFSLCERLFNGAYAAETYCTVLSVTQHYFLACIQQQHYPISRKLDCSSLSSRVLSRCFNSQSHSKRQSQFEIQHQDFCNAN
jgi:hypothetical protein